jgi:tRNA 5-methylaminomethyl-2-thiouridine biosynthesis bifunctional protein
MPTKPLRGQITRVSPESLSTPKSVVCGEGYLCPEVNDEIHFGATYDLTSSHSEVSEEDNIKNIDNILKWLPTWSNKETLTASLVGGSAGLRCTTPDYTPLVGRLPNTEEMLERFKGLRYDAKSCRETYGAYKANAYINIGHGSKGMITCPVSAQHIASLISGGPSPLDRELEMMLSPARFIIRGLSKNKL